MARGQQKIQAQQKRAEKNAKNKKQKDKKNKGGPSEKQTICLICKQMITQLSKDKKKSQPKLLQHVNAKHSKLTLGQCFPTYTDEAITTSAMSALSLASSKPKYKPDKEIKTKKKKFKRKGV